MHPCRQALLGEKGAEHKTGKMEKTNFFFGAVENKKDEAINIMNDRIVLSMERMVQKYDKI